MQTVNFLGGALFAFGSLSYIGNLFTLSSHYVVSQLGEIQRGPNDAVREEYLAVEKRETSGRLTSLAIAVFGAGLTCLRENNQNKQD